MDGESRMKLAAKKGTIAPCTAMPHLRWNAHPHTQVD
jgi:hypothetical protein